MIETNLLREHRPRTEVAALARAVAGLGVPAAPIEKISEVALSVFQAMEAASRLDARRGQPASARSCLRVYDWYLAVLDRIEEIRDRSRFVPRLIPRRGRP